MKSLLSAAVVSLLSVSGALAQTSPPAPAPAPAAKPAPQLPADAAGKFIASQSADQMVSSKFKGTDVLGPENEHIGDVTDLVFDKQGKVLAYVVGVGGFLGIGEKNVAIDPSAFQTTSSSSNDPTDVKLKVSWTKDQLKNAPSFEYYRAPAAPRPVPPVGTTR